MPGQVSTTSTLHHTKVGSGVFGLRAQIKRIEPDKTAKEHGQIKKGKLGHSGIPQKKSLNS